MKLMWLDVETTGLDASRHQLLEVAVIITDLTTPFVVEGTPLNFVMPLTESKLSTLDPFIIEMHSKNGLIDECLAKDKEMRAIGRSSTGHTNAASGQRIDLHRRQQRRAAPFDEYYYGALETMTAELSALIPDIEQLAVQIGKKEARERITALAGSSVHFDRTFLARFTPTLARNLSHRCYDVSAVKLFCRSLGMPKLPPEEAHRAMPDILESMGHAALCRDWLLARKESP